MEKNFQRKREAPVGKVAVTSFLPGFRRANSAVETNRKLGIEIEESRKEGHLSRNVTETG